MAAFFYCIPHLVERLLSEPVEPDNVCLVLLQLVNARKVIQEGFIPELFKNCFRQALDVHIILLAEMCKRTDFLCIAVRIAAVQEMTVLRFNDLKLTAAGGTGLDKFKSIALCIVGVNLRNNHICLIYLDLISDTQLEHIKIVHIRDERTADHRVVDLNRVKHRRHRNNTRSCGLEIYPTKGCSIGFIAPLVSQHIIVVVGRAAERLAVFDKVVLKDKSVNRIRAVLRLHAVNNVFHFRFGVLCRSRNIQTFELMHSRKAVLMEKRHLLGFRAELHIRAFVHGKSNKLQFSDDSVSVKLSDGACRNITGMTAGLALFGKVVFDAVEILPTENTLTTKNKLSIVGNRKRNT